VVVPIRQEQKRCSEDVVYEHLGVVLALLFDVDDKNLLNIERPLKQIVALEDAFDFPKRPAIPNAVQIEPELRVVHDVLYTVSFLNAANEDTGSRTMPSDHDAV
jgi:hypothetical protein